MKRRTVIVAAGGAVVLAVASFLLVHGGGGGSGRPASLTTDTHSRTLPDAPARVAFLSRYLKMHSKAHAAEFHVRYHDNSGGAVPGPSDWDIQAVLKVPPGDAAKWTADVRPVGTQPSGTRPAATAPAVDLSWGYALLPPQDESWSVRSTPLVYTRGNTIVAVFEPEGVVFKRTRSE